MFTSCGWFFDDFDRIEPRNNVSYTAQAVWLTYQATGADLSAKAVGLLRNVKSWRTGDRADSVFSHHLQRASTQRPTSVNYEPSIPRPPSQIGRVLCSFCDGMPSKNALKYLLPILDGSGVR